VDFRLDQLLSTIANGSVSSLISLSKVTALALAPLNTVCCVVVCYKNYFKKKYEIIWRDVAETWSEGNLVI
jgi:hypothetical protein